MRKTITVFFLILVIALPFLAFDVLPDVGDPESAPNTHVSDYYIEHAASDSDAPNMVTAVIVDYRAFDTMFETTVMFLSGLCVILIMANKPRRRFHVPDTPDKQSDTGGITAGRNVNRDVMISIIEPLILIYAMYVLFHGEVSPGGGFQAGALIGMTYLLDIITIKRERPIFRLPKYRSAALAGLGPFIYSLAGFICLAGGGAYLEYGKLPFALHQAELHHVGIVMVEIGVTIGVAGTIITISNALTERITFDDDL